MLRALKKLQSPTRKVKDRSQTSTSTPSVRRQRRPSTNHTSGISLDLITTPIIDRADDSSGEKKMLYLEAGITVLKHLKAISEATDILAPLKAASGAATVILETITAMESNNAAWIGLMQTIQRHRRTFQQQLIYMNAQNMPPDAEAGLLEPIRAYAQDLELILGALMLENGISTRNVPHGSKFQNLATLMKRYETVKVEAEKISGYVDQLNGSMKHFTASLTVYTSFKLHTIEQRLAAMDAKLTVSNPAIVTADIKLKPRPRVVPNFIGREDILEDMRRAHFNDGQSQQQAPVITVLSGVGGLGKTQTALKFALEFEEKDPDISIYFLDASTPEKLQAALETVIHSRGPAYQSKSYEDALVWLATELKNWLVILDNADDPDMDPVRYIPQCAHGHVIITTRDAKLAALAPNTSCALEGLSISDAITLLLTASRYPNDEENRSTAEMIVVELGSLPLALVHVAGYICVHRCLKTYLDMYRKNREKILASSNLRLLQDYQSSVAMEIKRS